MTATRQEVDTGDVLEPYRLGPVTLRNRLVKAATNEGMSRDGLVTDDLIEFHRRHAAGGVGASTLSYLSVSPEGRTFRHQLLARPEAIDGLRRLTDAVHAEGAAAAVQLAHAGWFANPRASGVAAVGPSRVFSPYGMGFPRAATEADLRRLLEDYRMAARLVADAGFDAVEVHVGHGYLLSQFLSPHTNRRTDGFGGSLEARARFPRLVCEAVGEEVGDRLAVWAKLNMADEFAGGMSLEEGIEVARMLEADGALHALQLTVGFTAKTPMSLMRGRAPVAEMLANERQLVRRLGMRAFAPFILKDLPYEEAYLLPYARQVRAATSLPLMLLGGVTELDTMLAARAEGFELVAMARALLREPDLPRRLAQGDDRPSACIHCNACMAEMERGGTRCVLVPDTEPPPPLLPLD